jgi:hypothetical protein
MKNQIMWRSLFSEYELGGCKKIEQIKEGDNIEISKMVPCTTQVSSIERVNIKTISKKIEGKIVIYATKSAEQLSIDMLLKVKDKSKIVEQLSKDLQSNTLFMNTFFLQFTNKLYHILQQHKDETIRKWLDELIKKDAPPPISKVYYGSSCPGLSINNHVIFEF